jgi:protein-S-isoprenylcysteine O-methyltransferase Ste14
MKALFMHVIGYLIGGTMFMVLIPLGLFGLSRLDLDVIGLSLIGDTVLRFFIALPFGLVGILFMLWSNIALLAIGKGGPADAFNVAVSPRTKKLVIVGPYKYTRNPMVFGAFLFYLASGLYFNSLLCLIVVALFFVLVTPYLKLTEEKRLLRDFGEDFVSYRKKVPMIIPFIKI